MKDEKISKQKDHSHLLHKLDTRQRKAVELFADFEIVTSAQIGKLFGFKPRTNSQICKKWCEEKFLEIADGSNKSRKYRLAKQHRGLIEKDLGLAEKSIKNLKINPNNA